MTGVNRPARRKLLFVCSRNRWRSPTAERMYRDSVRFEVRSRGTAASARRRLTDADVRWADVLLVMEPAHGRRIREGFREALGDRPMHVLSIPDRFRFMDAALVERIEAAVEEPPGDALRRRFES